VYCRDCPRHDPEAGRCRDGKTNPERYDQAVEVVRLFGLRAICTYNDHRERLIEVRQSGAPVAPTRRVPPPRPGARPDLRLHRALDRDVS
jgi:hypothetical protein